MRVRYEELMREPGKIEDILLAGAAKARNLSAPFMAELRHAVGLRNLCSEAGAKSIKVAKASLPVFKQYRERDGKFHFKLVDASGRLLLQSQGFDSPKDAGAAIGRLQKEGAAALQDLGAMVSAAKGIAADEIAAALQHLAEAA